VSVSAVSVGVEEERELQSFDSVRNVRVMCSFNQLFVYLCCFCLFHVFCVFFDCPFPLWLWIAFV